MYCSVCLLSGVVKTFSVGPNSESSPKYCAGAVARQPRKFSGVPIGMPSARDFDIPILGQLAATDLSLCDEFEPSPVKMIGFEAAFGRGGLGEQDLEDAPGNAHHTLIFADTDPELDDASLGIPSGIGRKAEKRAPPGMFC
jgi:hypothetical protein